MRILRTLIFVIATCLIALAQQQSSSVVDGAKKVPVKIRVSSGVIQGLVLSKSVPDAADLKSIKNSEVKVVFEIDESGKVGWAAAKEGSSALFERCTNAIRNWQFKPYLLNGQPVFVESYVYFHFNKGKASVSFSSSL
jgi:outer membrane biosynthesis protein TonB